MKEIAWHALSIKEVLAKLNSSPGGLSEREAAKRLSISGANEIAPIHPGIRSVSIFLSQFKSPLVYILILAALLTFYIQATFDALVIIAVLFANALIGFFQEWKAETGLATLKELINPQARVMRNGQLKIISTDALVPGDIVELEEGDHIPADLRLIEAIGLKIDEAVLSGESIPKEKSTAISDGQNTQLPNIAYKGTHIVVGRGLGVVIATGTKTAFGQLALSTIHTTAEPTPLSRNIVELSRAILLAVVAIMIVIIILGLVQGQELIDIFFLGVAAAIAAIPEGLPAVVTIALAVGVIRMAKRQAIVRQLASVETLGTINTIVSDKTGTLTENKLVIREIHLPNTEPISVTGTGYDTEGKFTQNERSLTNKLSKYLLSVIEIGVLANNARLIVRHNQHNLIGDPTEGAILVVAKKMGIDLDQLRQRWPRFGEIPFSSDRRFMVTTHYLGQKNLLVAAKGSLSTILNRAQVYQDGDGKLHPLTKSKRAQLLAQADQIASAGYRLIALATGELSNKVKLSEHNLPKLTYLGFLAMIDAPRTSAMQAVKVAQNSGIRVMMVTGDGAATALAVSKLMSINNYQNGVFTQNQLVKMNQLQFEEAVASANIFAEISPGFKLKIVEALVRQGAIIAVTGDGANDAPILKKAHVGVAMGQGGTDVAQAAAGIVLADNNFATIINAIEEGRVIFANIRRCLWYLLSTNSAELLIILVSLVAAWPVPFLPIHLLWINVITDGTATIGLAIEPKHHHFLHDQQRLPGEPLIDYLAAKRIALVAVVTTVIVLIFYWLKISNGQDLIEARSMAFVTLSFIQIANILNARSLKLSMFRLPLISNPFLIISMILSLFLTIATLEFPILQNLFKLTSPSFNDWLLIITSAVIIIATIEIHKWAIRLKGGGTRWA